MNEPTTHGISLATQYVNQFRWRDWERALSLCPIEAGQKILDLGCGPGDVTAALRRHGASVLGIDNNPELLAIARERHPDCVFEQRDLEELRSLPTNFDGLWCSFTAAYFVNFDHLFTQWCRHLKPSGWVCIVEMDDLFNHEPLSTPIRAALESFYEDAIFWRRYDFRAGSKLTAIMDNAGFAVRTANLVDQELCFAGPASSEVLCRP